MIYGGESRQWQEQGTRPTGPSKHLPRQEGPGDGDVAMKPFINCFVCDSGGQGKR